MLNFVRSEWIIESHLLCFYKDSNNILLKVVNYSQTENLYILSVNQPMRELASERIYEINTILYFTTVIK